jgi:hypothetical protein
MKKTEEGKHGENILEQRKSAYFEQNRGQVMRTLGSSFFQDLDSIIGERSA